MFKDIEKRHNVLIDMAKSYMKLINDNEHNIGHMYDVLYYTKKIIKNLNYQIDIDVCIIGAYWHDVGRIKIQDGHEKMSSKMLVDAMKKNHYKEEFIKKCSDSIKFHKWNMTPKTIEGLIIKDADKLAWLGSRRWKMCIKNRQRLDELVELLPKLRNEILYFDYTKKLYDEEILKIFLLLYNEIYSN